MTRHKASEKTKARLRKKFRLGTEGPKERKSKQTIWEFLIGLECEPIRTPLLQASRDAPPD